MAEFDEAFRHLKENSNLPWQKPVKQLRIKAVAANSLVSKAIFQPFREKQANRSSVKFCFAFHQVEKCFSVTSHICATHVREIISELGVKLTGGPEDPQSSNPVQVERLRHELQDYSFLRISSR